ncbi:MAG: hypothetical protein B9S34_07425 [Opitutia bacterium Tous-C1TDCM]|nr:MAG: hypothetical protein B9S34_07425 [Opitutae bacterium Tous-C1TDCM]
MISLRSLRRRVSAAFGLAASALAAAAVPPAPTLSDAERAQLQFFEKEVRPILANRCYECHGDKKHKGELRLDHISHILKGGESGPALVRGKPDDSLLVTAIRYDTEDLQMPPDEKLPEAEIAVLEKWIQLGAPWPAADAAAGKTAEPKDEFGFTASDRAYWVFQPLAKPVPPAPKSPAAAAWVANDIDRFIAAKHAEHGLVPAPAADKAELARRIYFDLHGLPPTRAQLEAFVNDPAPDAYARLVDTLLASPRYGERWAQHWLDIVRFAESDGYRADGFRPGAWPYRDYVIASFNADKPYDRFVREQLAGDELAPHDPAVVVATSYLRNPIYEWNQRDVRGQAELIVTDLTDNAGEVFLGLSMGCARCHDHKFDPILQQDYYRFRAFFEPVLWPSDLKLATAEERARHAAQTGEWEKATAEIRAEMEAMVGAEQKRAVQKAHDRFTADIQAMLLKPAAERTAQEHILATIADKQLLYEVERFDPIKALKKPEEKARYRVLETELKKFDSLKPKDLLEGFVATDAGPLAPPTKFKTRKGEHEVTPGFLSLLDPQPAAVAALPNSTGRRSALAAWITRPENPLATRTIVNRIWQYHFGRGLAGTPNDLGHLGERPTHPELLDFLAQRFVAGGWKFKALHREILLSATYRQTARLAVPERAALVDPDNKFLWRFTPRRLDAEQARDAILAASGELDLAAGGPSAEANTAPRRSIYTIKKRNNQNEFLRSLDAPPGFTGIAERQRTSTPLQALMFMNGDWIIARARKLGASAGSVENLWQATLGRSPSAQEKQMADAFLAQRIAAAQAPTDAPLGPVALSAAAAFRENTPQERLVSKNAPREGDDFTVEAVFTLDSIDAGAAVRTIASRWNGEKSALEAHGWSLGVTGAKSGFKPRHLLLQLVGEDDNMNTAYEAVPSGIFLELGKTYHVAVRVSCSDHQATFSVRPLVAGDGAAAVRTATVKHAVVGKLGTGQASPVIGGLYRRSASQFDGQITAARIVHGLLPDDALHADPAQWTPETRGLAWSAAEAKNPYFTRAGGTANAESPDPKIRALTDLAHVLLNANEFIYLH